jgi:hypothetical protein
MGHAASVAAAFPVRSAENVKERLFGELVAHSPLRESIHPERGGDLLVNLVNFSRRELVFLLLLIQHREGNSLLPLLRFFGRPAISH